MTRKAPKPPRRRAKQARAKETVQVVLAAAARVLEARGYAAATTNRIAEAAGVSVGTVYEYFADKEAIFDALIERQIDEIVDAIRNDPFDPEAPVGATVRRLLRLALSSLRGGPGFLRALEQVPNASFRRRLQLGREQVKSFVRLWLESRRAVLRVTDLDLAAFVVVSTAEAVAINAGDDVFAEPLVDELATLLNLYLTGTETGVDG